MTANNANEAGIDYLFTLVVWYAHDVANTVWYGFVKKIHGNTLAGARRRRGFAPAQQGGVVGRCDGGVIEVYIPELLCGEEPVHVHALLEQRARVDVAAGAVGLRAVGMWVIADPM